MKKIGTAAALAAVIGVGIGAALADRGATGQERERNPANPSSPTPTRMTDAQLDRTTAGAPTPTPKSGVVTATSVGAEGATKSAAGRGIAADRAPVTPGVGMNTK
jgi:hypothetical protein